MWRLVYEKSPKGGRYDGAGPWHRSKEEADSWLTYLYRFYPEAHIQSWSEAYPHARLEKHL